MRPALLSLFVILFVSSSIRCQSIRPAELTDEVLAQVVKRILRYEIKPGRKPRTVFLSGTSFLPPDETPVLPIPIQPEWLPAIPNIDFKIYDENDYPDLEGYYFWGIEEVNRRFEISVGYGNLGIGGGEGHIWSFRVERGNVRLWLVPNSGFGWSRDTFF